MQLVVLATNEQKTELAVPPIDGVTWIENEDELSNHSSADLFVDLTYSNTLQRNALLAQLHPATVVVNAVVDTLLETDASFVRINGWPTFLNSQVLEAACNNPERKAIAEEGFKLLNRQLTWLPDEPGFVTARVVSMIINEAFLALEEGVSTKEEINTAMKLGTAYPFGPFEWAEKIGLPNIAALLKKRSQVQPHYTPSALLVSEAEKLT